ncbi:MAG TPA: folylpolyglutamate synthase/dihydrofolate synthase family protein [archaeon]|nr:folylpolyglutamate synthase/dihydrofolate synthase family protein [archaeon]
MAMDYAQSKKWLDSLGTNMSGFDLENTRKMCKLAKLDLKRLRAIQVAGSNGKGSTCAFISSILNEAGYKTGLYTSPHLVEPTERIQISGKNISKEKFAELAVKTRKVIEANFINASEFEALTAMAFMQFIDEKVDFLVAETGLGGRLDATNVLESAVSVITSISLEHTQYLGSTIEKIAAEKAGIIKENSIAVASQENAGIKIIQQKVRAKKCKIIMPKFKINSLNADGGKFDLAKPIELHGLEIKMAGEFQCQNAALAVCAVHALSEKGILVPENAIRNGLKKTLWRGRLEKIQEKPIVLLDAAHNPKGFENLFAALPLYKYEKLFVVFGAMADKDVSGIGTKFAVLKAHVIFTKVESERAQEPEKLLEKIGFGEIAVPAKNAIELAMEKAGKNDLVLITGSIYLLGEAYRHFGIKIQ